MDRLDFRLDDFTRVQWAPGARKIWEPRLSAVVQAWQSIEIDCVINKVKPSALLVVAPENLPDISRQVSEAGLIPAVLGLQGRTSGPYAATTLPYASGQPFDYRVAITTPTMVDHWYGAWETRNDLLIGILLGYPECCRNFFQQYWTDQGFVDTTWFQALNSGVQEHNHVIDITPDPLCNVTLRALGIRGVSHLPCSFFCEPTRQIAGEVLKIVKLRYPSIYKTIMEVLNWPIKWSALHGIAEITTPVCRVITRTDATASTYVIRQHGSIYPEEGSRGIEFPFRENVPQKVHLIRKDIWTDNGFSSYEAMVEAHNVVLDAAGDLSGLTVIDLGCGNGELLRKVKPTAAEVHGVDLSVSALEEATKVAFVRRLNIFDPEVLEQGYDVAFVSVQRLMEESDEVVETFLQTLRERTRATVFYSYGESQGWQKVPSVAQSAAHVIVGPNVAARYEWRQDDDSYSHKEPSSHVH